MTTGLVFRPRFAIVGRPFWMLAGVYLVLGAALCCSLSTWAISWVVGVVIFAVFVLVMAVGFALTFGRTSILVDNDTVAYTNAWGRPTRILNRSEIVRVISIDRIQGSLPGGVLLLVARDGRRIGAGHWLWGADLLDEVTAAVVGDRRPPERWLSASPFDLLRELGVDPAIRRRPVAHVAMLLASAVAGVLIAWPIVTAVL
jgi:hypothetical protein